ncbi:ribonuclease D [Lignipirellula cremea]|uniref:Ribonuclease D n=1 Tax=Lignipirellula cremea TaxID=2528010 RepID=A0A518DUS4_9BACT|nr:HRDC domain-containing protein [Lignipirellula cremea]QDU95574.1 Ribonuclease D [Lignipirellula cremea]
MQYEHITSDSQLQDYCARLAQAEFIAFDTEFISEDTYRPDLCLIQVAAGDALAVIDPKACEDVTLFWETLAAFPRQTIVHAGREELRFCLQAVQAPPPQLIDVQLAAGMIGLEYPAAYGTLIHKLLGKTLPKGETRTDWRRRPLTDRQMEYALQDVIYLAAIRDQLLGKLDELDRRSWFLDEMTRWQNDIIEAEAQQRWRRVSGISGLGRRALAIVRELWQWREEEAQARNSPPKRILRDDLIIELARRQTSDVKRIRAVRGMERSGLQRHLDDLGSAVDRAMNLPEADLPSRIQSQSSRQHNLLGQFLASALSSICRDAQIAPSLVGSGQDVRELVASLLNKEKGEKPSLSTGWRAEVVGNKIADLLSGKLVIAVVNPNSEQPLAFEPRQS